MKRYLLPLMTLLGLALVFTACLPTSPAPAPANTPVQPTPTEEVIFPTRSGPTPENPTPTAAPFPGPGDVTPTPIPGMETPVVFLTALNFGHFNPVGAGGDLYTLASWVYDSLFVPSSSGELLQILANSAAPSQDGLTWTVDLRQPVRWQDLRAVTVEDVIFTFNYLKEKVDDDRLAAITTINAPDDHTVVFQLSQPVPNFLDEVLAKYFILPAYIWEAQPEGFVGEVGSGPYKIVKLDPEKSVFLERRGAYHLMEPELKKIEIRYEPDPMAQVEMLKSGAAAAILSSLSAEQLSALQGVDGVTLVEGDAGTFAYRPDQYAGWQYVNGQGISTRWSLLPPLQ